jgi:hypothetical protein
MTPEPAGKTPNFNIMNGVDLQGLNDAWFNWSNCIIMFGALTIGAVAVFCWVIFFQKKRRRKRKHRGHERVKPTLAQVGGLPPVRKPGETRRDDNPSFGS